MSRVAHSRHLRVTMRCRVPTVPASLLLRYALAEDGPVVVVAVRVRRVPAPDPDAFEWEAPVISVAALQRPRLAAPAVDPVPEPVRASTPTVPDTGTVAPPDEPGRARIRQRYFTVRFPGAPASAADGKDPAATIKAARLHFEDGDGERAVELL